MISIEHVEAVHSTQARLVRVFVAEVATLQMVVGCCRPNGCQSGYVLVSLIASELDRAANDARLAINADRRSLEFRA
jgi:hypothetical protein